MTLDAHWARLQADARRTAEKIRNEYPELAHRAEEAEQFAIRSTPEDYNTYFAWSQEFTLLKAGWNFEMGSIRRHQMD